MQHVNSIAEATLMHLLYFFGNINSFGGSVFRLYVGPGILVRRRINLYVANLKKIPIINTPTGKIKQLTLNCQLKISYLLEENLLGF